ncbi:MAG: ATP-binding protein, partial [Acidimicrobiales bacterium]
MTALYEDGRAGRRVVSLVEAPPGLPRPLGTFIGRHEDVAALTELVATCRLITIAGAGGVGKTQLALQVAARGDDQTRDGTWLVELAGVTDPDGVGDAVIREVAAGSEDGDVVEALRPCRGLLILDSCDHVLDACAQLVTRLMQACPELTVVATSREPFGLTGERIWWLSPLSAEESVELFSERARQIGTVAAASDEDAEAMAEICRRLDGLPLAIELAAARRGLLTPAEILVRLDDLFPFMRRTRDGAPRHRSLETSFDWSHRLLASEEATLLRRLSVFAGGCYLAAAEAVCSGDGLERAGVLDLLAALVSKSLVVADQARGGTRYRLLLTTADCAGTELEAAGETDAVHDRHARWCVERAEEARHGRNGPDHDEWLARLDEDLDNFRAALTWARDEGQLEVALRLANALTWFWKTRGLAREGLGWVQWAIAQSGDAPAAWRAEAMRGAGQLLHMLGDDRSGVAFVDRSVTMFREVGDAEEGGGCVCQDTLQMCHNPLHALPALEQKVATVRTFGDPNRLAHALYNLGQARFFRGDAGGARICFAEVLSLRPRIDGEATDNALLGLARVALLVGNYDAVEPPLLEVLQHSGRIADRDTRSAALSLLAEAARARGDTRRARALLDDAMDLARAAGSPLSVGRCERILGTVELADGALGAAEALFTQALRGARSGPRLAYHELRCLLGLAEVAAASGQTGMAARWY